MDQDLELVHVFFLVERPIPVNCTATGIRTVIGSKGICIVSSDKIRCDDLRDIGDTL